jgi:hypothetical protein
MIITIVFYIFFSSSHIAVHASGLDRYIGSLQHFQKLQNQHVPTHDHRRLSQQQQPDLLLENGIMRLSANRPTVEKTQVTTTTTYPSPAMHRIVIAPKRHRLMLPVIDDDSDEVNVDQIITTTTTATTTLATEEAEIAVDDDECTQMITFGRTFGITDVLAFSRDNCHLLQMYYPGYTCDQITAYVGQCAVVL